jgi:uncharacterized protein (TIGR02271 family)
MNTQNPTSWIGRNAIDSSGDKIGKITEIYLDDQTGQPEWLTAKTGLFGTRSSFVPLAGAAPTGDDVQVQYTKDQVKDAPNVDEDGHISEAEEAELYRHYGITAGRTSEPTTDTTGSRGKAGTTDDAMTDDAMTRSEEGLDVGKVEHEAGRARLRKWVETEHVETKVPVAHDEVRVEREPITDANRGDAVDGPEISESEHEVVLHEEEAVANTRVEPKERIRLDKQTVVDEETVGADVRKEHVEVEGDATTRR